LALRDGGQRVLLVAVPERAGELDALEQQFPGGPAQPKPIRWAA